jgi:hypothetical protein
MKSSGTQLKQSNICFAFTHSPWCRLQQPFGQEGCPSLFSDYPVDREIFVLLVVFDRLVGGRSEVAIHIYDRKAAPLVQHQLKMFYYRGTALWVRTLPQHGQTKSDLYVSHDTYLSFGATLIIRRRHAAR